MVWHDIQEILRKGKMQKRKKCTLFIKKKNPVMYHLILAKINTGKIASN